MITHQLINSNSGDLMSGAYAMASAASIYTEGILIERSLGQSGLLLQATGSIALTRQVSVDNVNWITPYNEHLKSTGTVFTLHHGDSGGYYSLYNPESSHAVMPWIRFKVTAAVAATISTFSFVQETDK